MANAKDLTGQRFGRLTVIQLHPEPYRSPAGKPTRRWICRCDCGKELIVLQNALTGKNGTRSCGCAQREKAAQPKIDLTGQRFGRWTVLQRAPLSKKATNGERNGWLCHCDCGTYRVVMSRLLVNGKSRSCGCLLAEKAANRIDIDKDNVLQRFDGTFVSAIRPTRGPNKNNKSGVKGVYWHRTEQKWVAKIGLRGKEIALGRFDTLEAATRARKNGEEKYFNPIIAEYEKKTGE